MSCWQYAQLVVAIDERRPDDEAQTMLWLGPHQESAENISPGEQTIIQLLNRFDADGWELIAVQEQRTGGARCSCVRRVIAGELAVRRLAARPDVVRKQLYHLATACNGRRGSTVRVLPVGALLDGFSVPGCAFSTYACPGPGTRPWSPSARSPATWSSPGPRAWRPAVSGTPGCRPCHANLAPDDLVRGADPAGPPAFAQRSDHCEAAPVLVVGRPVLKVVPFGPLVPCLDDQLLVVGQEPQDDRRGCRQRQRCSEGIGQQFADQENGIVGEVA